MFLFPDDKWWSDSSLGCGEIVVTFFEHSSVIHVSTGGILSFIGSNESILKNLVI
jgi:hypothetical protein